VNLEFVLDRRGLCNRRFHKSGQGQSLDDRAAEAASIRYMKRS